MNNDTALVIIGAIVFIIFVRLLLSIPKQLRYQRAIIRLLALNAKQRGADPDTIGDILKEADRDFQHDPHFKTTDK